MVRDATTTSQPRHQQMYEKAAVAKKKKDEKKKKYVSCNVLLFSCPYLVPPSNNNRWPHYMHLDEATPQHLNSLPRFPIDRPPQTIRFEDQELEKCTFAPKTNSSRRSGSKQRGGSQSRSNSNNRVMAPSPVPPPLPPPPPNSAQTDANAVDGIAAPPTKLGDAAVWRRHMLQAGGQHQRQANRTDGKALTADVGSIRAQSAAAAESSPGRRSNSASDLDSPQHRDSPTPSGYSASSFAPTASEVEDDSPKNRVLNVMQHRRRQRAVSANNNERNSR